MERRRLRRACRRRRRRPHLQGRCSARRIAVDVDPSLWAPRGSHADAWLRCNLRGRDGGIREKAGGESEWLVCHLLHGLARYFDLVPPPWCESGCRRFSLPERPAGLGKSQDGD
jgi:hypothetical protein